MQIIVKGLTCGGDLKNAKQQGFGVLALVEANPAASVLLGFLALASMCTVPLGKGNVLPSQKNGCHLT